MYLVDTIINHMHQLFNKSEGKKIIAYLRNWKEYIIINILFFLFVDVITKVIET